MGAPKKDATTHKPVYTTYCKLGISYLRLSTRSYRVLINNQISMNGDIIDDGIEKIALLEMCGPVFHRENV